MHVKSKRAGVLSGIVGVVAAAALLFATPASAQVTPPPSVVPIGGATNSTISDVKINGTTTTLAVLSPGAAIAMQAKLTLGSGVNPGWGYWAGYGWVGAASPSGCSAPVGGVGSYTTTDFNLAAPTTAGIYNVGAALGPDPCPWASPNPGVTIATIVVTSYSSACTLTQSYATDPYVAQGLCDKLFAAEQAAGRNQPKVKASLLRAYNLQLAAQTGKSFTAEQAETLTTLVSYL